MFWDFLCLFCLQKMSRNVPRCPGGGGEGGCSPKASREENSGAGKRGVGINQKSETRNPNQIRMTKSEWDGARIKRGTSCHLCRYVAGERGVGLLGDLIDVERKWGGGS